MRTLFSYWHTQSQIKSIREPILFREDPALGEGSKVQINANNMPGPLSSFVCGPTTLAGFGHNLFISAGCLTTRCGYRNQKPEEGVCLSLQPSTQSETRVTGKSVSTDVSLPRQACSSHHIILALGDRF